jgi:hypothetical protein
LNFIIHHMNIQQNIHTNHHSHFIWGHFYNALCLKGLQFCLTSPPSSLISFLNGGSIFQITMLLVCVYPITSFVQDDRHQRKLVCTYVIGDVQSCSLILYNEEQGHNGQDLVRKEQHKYNLLLGSELIYGSKHWK